MTSHFLRSVALFFVCIFIAACTSVSQYFTEGYGEFSNAKELLDAGKYDDGLAQMLAVSKKYPRNFEYKITLMNKKVWVINQYISAAEAALEGGRISDAEKNYHQALQLDPNHNMAKQGMAAVMMEREHRILLSEAEDIFKKNGANSDEALDRLHTILVANPNHKLALNLKYRIEDAKSLADRKQNQLADSFKKPISIEFRDAPLKSIFDVVAKISGLNFFYDRDVRPDIKATVQTKNTSIEEVVHLLLTTNQLDYKVLNNKSILIYPNTPQKQKDYQQLMVRTFFLANADVKNISNLIKTIVKAKDIVIDERLGTIVMRDTPEAIRVAEKIISVQDIGDPEVMLEVEILEIKRNTLTELGIRWPDQLVLSPLKQGSASSLTLTQLIESRKSASLISATIGGATINARKEDQDSNILANPRIRVRNKDKAKILIGDRVPVITTTSTSTGFVSESVSYADVGLKLEVEPNIYLDDEVAIKINLEVSSLVKEVTSKSGTLTYQIGTRGANTVLRLKDGETQILAGLISDEERNSAYKVPGFGDVPVLGRLFSSQKDDKQRSEVVLSITPRILRSLRRPSLRETEFLSGTESNVGARDLSLSIQEPEKKVPVTTSDPANVRSAILPSANTQKIDSAPLSSPAVVPMTHSEKKSQNQAVGDIKLSWDIPKQIKVGEQFSAILRINSQAPLRGLPMMLAYDTDVLQVVSIQEGDFLKQGNNPTQFNQRIDTAQGKVFISTVRQNQSGGDAGINGLGSLVRVNLKAIKSGNAKLQLLSISPDPMPSTPIALPIEQLLKIIN